MSDTQKMFADNVSQNDDTKNKVTSLEIIVRMIDSKPYYEIRMSEAEYMEDGADYLEEGCQRQTCDGCMACNYCLIKEQEDERGTANKERRQNYEYMGRP